MQMKINRDFGLWIIHMDNRSESGQSTIEFIMAFLFTFGFIFSFLKIAIIYTNGYMVHYGTFMAARAYMVKERDSVSNQASGSDGESAAIARKVFNSFKLSSLIPGLTGELQINDPESLKNYKSNLYVGVYIDFKEKLLTPVGGITKELNLRSEAFLGKEPTRAECFDRTCVGLGSAFGVGRYCLDYTTVADNGC